MRRHHLPLLGLLLLTSCTETQWQQTGRSVLGQISSASSRSAPLTATEIDAGLREALRVGSERVVIQLGRRNGYYADPKVFIPLPEKIATARSYARKVGLDRSFNELEERLNRAAEAAAPQAKALFWQAIRDLRMADLQPILNGQDDAATRYFEGKMSPQLALSMQPVVDRCLNEVGAVRTYKKALQEYNALPLAPKIEADLTDYVVNQAMQGIFYYLAEEEAAIRHDPLKRTSQILQRVFGA